MNLFVVSKNKRSQLLDRPLSGNPIVACTVDLNLDNDDLVYCLIDPDLLLVVDDPPPCVVVIDDGLEYTVEDDDPDLEEGC